MHTSLRKAAAACLLLAAGSAYAAGPLQNAVITASYNGDPTAMLGNDHGYAAETGSNISSLDPYNTSVEFLTADFLFGFDFAADGRLTIYSNNPIPAGSYRASFDFGGTLAGAIESFSVASSGDTSGTPVLTVVNDHTISVDLSGVTWNTDYGAFDTQIALAAPVPEPSAAWMLLAGLAGLSAARLRARRR